MKFFEAGGRWTGVWSTGRGSFPALYQAGIATVCPAGRACDKETTDDDHDEDGLEI
jgi:hypothetical protein